MMRHFESVPLESELFSPGHVACPGCGEAQAIKFLLNALGPDTMMVTLPSCLTTIAGGGPLSSFRIPVFNTAFAAGAATASGLARAVRLRGDGHVTVAVLAGDGATYDIGIQAISAAAERGEDILFICLDNEGYMNTGAQKSSATPRLAYTGSTPQGKPSPKKDMMEILAAHRIPYAATCTVAYPDDLVRKVQRARATRGFRFLEVLTPCLPGWGMGDHLSVRAARLAVETRYFPLYEVEGGLRWTISRRPAGLPVREFLELQDRFRHLTPEQTASVQAEVDENWERLVRKAGGGQTA